MSQENNLSTAEPQMQDGGVIWILDDFVIDTLPSETPNAVVPKYELCNTTHQNDVGLCFNCAGDHLLADCKQSKDMKRIGVARRKFMTNKNDTNTRYHHRDKQYNYLIPGQISNRLRQALKLNEHELPYYIYRMRILGYPPGWKLKAQVESTDLQLYDSDGNIQNTPRTKYIDESQIIKYPGFNVPVPEGIKDDYTRYNYPPYNEQNSLQNIDIFIKNNFDPGYQLLSPTDSLITKDKPKTTDQAGSLMTKDKPKTTDQACSLIPENEAAPLVEPQCATVIEDQINQLLPSTENDCQPEPDIKSKVNGTSSGVIVTTIVPTNSSTSKLPSLEKFSEGISPLILFENLSNSTGNYDEISNVIKKIREQKLSKKNDEN